MQSALTLPVLVGLACVGCGGEGGRVDAGLKGWGNCCKGVGMGCKGAASSACGACHQIVH